MKFSISRLFCAFAVILLSSRSIKEMPVNQTIILSFKFL